MTEPLLDIRGLSISLPKGSDRAHAVEDLNITVNPGEITCVVGEFGIGQIAHSARGHGSPAAEGGSHGRRDHLRRPGSPEALAQRAPPDARPRSSR